MAMFRFGRRAPAAPRGHELADSALPVSVAELLGPGWYDSSWDLQRGLVVREGLPSDAPLQIWLEHHLHGELAQAA